MRIALVSGSFLPKVGGLEWKVHYLGAEFVRHGHEVTVFTQRCRITLRPIEIPVEPNYRIVWCGFPIRGIGRLGVMRRLMARTILKHHRARPFDVLHCHHLGEPTQWAVNVKLATGVPVVGTTTGGDIQIVPGQSYGDRRRPHIDRIVRENLRKVDVIGAVSHAVREDLEGLGTTARIVDIPNGVAWSDFQITPRRTLRTRLGLSDDGLVVLSVGRNILCKAYDSGIRAFARVAGRFQNACYVLVGRGTDELAPLVAGLGLNSRVRLVDQVPMSELPEVFHSADIFFNPSQMEGFAQVNAQALASGLPCVVTDAPGNRDAGEHGGALIARSGDVQSMAEALAQLLADPDRRRQLGREAHQAGKRYAWSQIAEEYLAVFEDLVSQRARADH